MQGYKQLLLALLLSGLSLTALAKDNFEVKLFLGNYDPVADRDRTPDDEFGFSSLSAALDASESNQFATLPGYEREISATTAVASLHGAELRVSYEEGSKHLRLSIPHLDIEGADSILFECETQRATGCLSRDESEEEFRDYLRNNEDDIVGRLLRSFVAHNGTDPVSGNPNSLMYSMATDTLMGNMDAPIGKNALEERRENNKEVGLSVGHYSFDGNESTILHVPASYTYYFEDPEYYLKFSGTPIAYIETNGSRAFKSAGSAAYHLPMNDQWALMPGVGLGFVGSEDMGSVALVGSASLTSMYETQWGDTQIKLGNMLSTFKTSSVDVDEGVVDYGLSNHIVKNALSAKLPTKVQLLERDLDVEVTFADTRILGDEVFIDQYNEVAVSLGSPETKGDRLDAMRLGFTYTFGNTNKDFDGETHDYNGFSLNFGYSF